MPESPAELGPLLTFGGLKPAPRTLEAVQEAVVRLRDPAAEGRESVTWFRLATELDRGAYARLAAGDLAGARASWERATLTAPEERSAEENLAVLHHILALANPDEPASWVEPLAWLTQAAAGGNIHRQDIASRAVEDLAEQARRCAAEGDNRRLMETVHTVAPYLEEEARGRLEEELFKPDLDRLRLDCADLRGQLLTAQGESAEAVRPLEKAIGARVVPGVERLLQTGLPGPSQTASREAALIYRSLARAWGVLREGQERCLAMESAVRYAPQDLREELLRELETARLDRDGGGHRPDEPKRSEQLPPPAERASAGEPHRLPTSVTFLGTGLRLSRSGPDPLYEASYDVTLLGIPIFPVRRYQVVEEFPGSPSSVDLLPLTSQGLLMRVLCLFVAGFLLLLGAGNLAQGQRLHQVDAQRRALTRQIDEVLEQVSERAQRLHRLEIELNEARQQEERLGEGSSLDLWRSRKARLEADRARVSADHEKLLTRLYQLEARRRSLR